MIAAISSRVRAPRRSRRRARQLQQPGHIAIGGPTTGHEPLQRLDYQRDAFTYPGSMARPSPCMASRSQP
jgi:hypothetical protein